MNHTEIMRAAAALPAPEQSQLQAVEADLGNLCERLAQSTGQLGSIADRVFGTYPQAVAEPAKGSPACAGVLSQIGERLAQLSAEIGAIEERTKRLSDP